MRETVKATDTTAAGYVRRRYVRTDGRRRSTIEVPLEVWNDLVGSQRSQRWAEAHSDDPRVQQALDHARAGMSVRDSAALIGVGKSTVQGWRSQHDHS